MLKQINKRLLELGFEVADHTQALLAYWDTDLICRFANSSYMEWFGKKPEDMTDKIHIRELLGEHLFKENLPFIEGALAGEKQVFERDIRMFTGEVRPSIATYCPDIYDNKVKGFFVHVADISYQQKRLQQEQEMKPANQLYDSIKEIERMLHADIFNDFPGITKLAKLHYISESRLKKEFKEKYNQTVFEYYRFLQMKAAETYINEKKYSKKQVAILLNFANPSNFSVCYKKYISKKNAEQELLALKKASAVQYEIFIAQSPFAIAMLNNKFQYITTSQKWLTDFHLQQKEITGTDLFENLPQLRLQFTPMFTNALNGIADNGEDLFFVKDSKTAIWLKWDVRPWYTLEKKIGGILVYTENVTTLKEQIQENEKIFEIFSKTSEVARIGAWKRNFKTGATFWNKITRQILEVSESYQPTLETSINFYKRGKSRELIQHVIQKAIEEGVAFDVVAKLITAKGNCKKVRVIGYPVFKDNTCEKLLGIFQDITGHEDTIA